MRGKYSDFFFRGWTRPLNWCVMSSDSPATSTSPTPASPSPSAPVSPTPVSPTPPSPTPVSPTPSQRPHSPVPLHRVRSPAAYYSHPERPGYEQRLAAALAHLHTHPHWRDVVSAVALLHRGVDISAESYGPNTRGPAGDVMMRLRAAVPVARSQRWVEPLGPALWIYVGGHCLLVICLIATIIALTVQKLK